MKIKLFTILIAFISLISNNSFSDELATETHLENQVGFQGGNHMTSYPVRAMVYVSCQEGARSKSVTYQCNENILAPSEMNYFIGPKDIIADKVELVCSQSDGTVVSKEAAYDSKKGRSTKRFNLWISSLTQKPLLYLGENKINFTMKKNGVTVVNGQFTVQVDRHSALDCGYDTVYSGFLSDCENESFFCRKYLDQRNYCQ